MSLEDNVININKDYTDSLGNKILWSNDVLTTYYYNATTSGTEEDWVKNWTALNVVSNFDFNTEEPGGSWELVTDSPYEPYATQLCRTAMWNNTDLIQGASVTSSGYTYPYYDSYTVSYVYADGWETDDGVSPGAAAITFDLASVQDVNYFWFTPGWGVDTTKFIKEYRIGVSDTGLENEFTVVASGTTVSGSAAPMIDFLGNIQTRYIKVYVDSNWGHASRSRLWKASAFYEPDWSMFGYNNDGWSQGTDAYWQQTVNLTNVDTLFIDVRAHMSSASQVGVMTVLASGVGGSSDDVLQNYDWSTSGSWLDTNDLVPGTSDNYYWTRREEVLDVSSYTSTSLKLRIYNETQGKAVFFGFFDNIYTSPLWYRETFSEYRSNVQAFPDETYIVSDRVGLSIIDKSTLDLWMRFNIGPGYALESAALDVVAKEGCIYVATTRGLIIIDFNNNRIWKIDEVGVYYRMSIGRRNEYGMWFLETGSHKLSSNSLCCVDFGTHDGDFFVVVGHSYGMSYIENPTVVSTRVVNNSVFTYPVRKIKTYSGETGDVNRIVFVGGYNLRARLGVIEDITSVKTGSFDDSILFFHSTGLENDLMHSGISSQWEVSDGELDLYYSPEYVTLSGIKTSYGPTTLLQKELVPDQPFVATLDVKINKWPERGNGGLHFGVTSGWPVSPILYEVTSQALSLSAINGIEGVVIEDEDFSIFPNTDNWKLTLESYDNSQVTTSEGALKLLAYVSFSWGVDYAAGSMLGHMRTFAAQAFTAKVKVRCTQLDLSIEDARQNSVVFGISDGLFLGEGSGTHLLCMGLRSHFIDANPPHYSIGYTATEDRLYWDTLSQFTTSSGDMTSLAGWRQWEFTYDPVAETLNAAIDGMFIGEYQYTPMGTDIGIIMGAAGNVLGGTTTAYFKDFEIDFGENSSNATREYVAQTYDDGVFTIPTASGTHLDGMPFSELDGTYSANWRTWKIVYDVESLSCYVDDVSVGDPVVLGLGNNNQRVFVHYNQPAVASGTESDRTVDINIKNFNIDYNSGGSLLKGSPNNFWLEGGSYLGVDYNSLFVATTSGIERLTYGVSATVSGTPISTETLGVEGSGLGLEVLYGNIRNVASVEVSDGSVLSTGLLYAGSSRYALRGWERLVDRAGDTISTNEVGINVSPDGSKIYEFFNAAKSYIYSIDTGSMSSSWNLLLQSDYPIGVSSLQSRGYVFDMQDGNLYCVGPTWFAVYNKATTEWITPTVNIGVTPITTSRFDYWEAAFIYSKSQLFLLSEGENTLMSLSERYWTGPYRHSRDLWWTDFSACVYSDVDDSIYALRQGTTDNFHRMPMDTLIFSDPLPDCPFAFDFDYGISAFYRPYDESVYFVMQGSAQSYGRRLLRFDVKSQEWSTWGEDFPSTVSDFMTASYAFEEDALYVIAGIGSTTMYKYYFPRDIAPRFISWDQSGMLLPEDSLVARFRKISFSTDAGNPSDDFGDGSVAPQWYKYIYGIGGSIEESGDSIDMVCTSTSPHGNSSIVRPVPVPACDFSASVKVKINDMTRSTGAAATSRNMVMLGITDFLGLPGTYAGVNEIEMGMSVVGMSGLFMVATNDVADDVNRYSLYKADQGVDVFYNTSQYEDFNSTDATGLAEYREWRIDYSHSSKQIDSYIDDVLVGTTTLAGGGFKHGASLFLGAHRILNAVSGTIDVSAKDLVVTEDSSSLLVSNYLEIDDSDEYGYLHYEKLDATIVSGTGYAFESDWRIETYSLSDNSYVCSVGSMEDGQKQATLAALYTSNKEIGFYMGGDPREYSSYTSVEHDWTVRSTYKILSDADTLKLYIDGSSTPAINISYDSLPNTVYRRCRFGSLNPSEERFLWSSSRVATPVTVSGSWSHGTIPSTFYGRSYLSPSASTSVGDKVVLYSNDSSDGYLYMFYSVYTDKSVTVPITIYHGGIIDLPVPDSFATNPIVSVSDNVDEYGDVDISATKLVLSQRRYADGGLFGRIPAANESPSGWVYLGKYTNIDHVVVTCDGTGGTPSDRVCVDSFKIKYTDTQPRARSVSRVYSVSYTIGEKVVKKEDDYKGGFTVVDMGTGAQLDAYSNNTSPSILDSNISDFYVT